MFITVEDTLLEARDSILRGINGNASFTGVSFCLNAPPRAELSARLLHRRAALHRAARVAPASGRSPPAFANCGPGLRVAGGSGSLPTPAAVTRREHTQSCANPPSATPRLPGGHAVVASKR